LIQPHKFEVSNLALQLAQEFERLIAKQGKVSLAIPGGRSPGPLLKELARACEAKVADQLFLYWVDERCVPEGHSDRNDAATLAFWREGGKDPAYIRTMAAERENLQAACDDYTAQLQNDGFGSGLDVAILGIGEDGHFASLFPNHEKLQEQAITFYLEDSPKPPPKRLSLSLPFIAAAKKIVILILGSAKGEMLKKAMTGPSEACPVSLLLDRTNASFYFDEAALVAFEA